MVNFRKLKTVSMLRWNALIDRGANGSIAGTDMKVIDRSERTIDLSGLDDHTVRGLTIVTAGGVVETSAGEIIVIIHHCADMTTDSRTIISVPQLEAFGCVVDDKSEKVSGRTPSIIAPGGYIIPITLRHGLPYIRMRTFGNEDWEKLPHVALTSPHEWIPASLDNVVTEQWYREEPKDPLLLKDAILNEHGELKNEIADGLDMDDIDDRKHQAVDRGKITAFLTRIISDELIADEEEWGDTYEVHQSDRARR